MDSAGTEDDTVLLRELFAESSLLSPCAFIRRIWQTPHDATETTTALLHLLRTDYTALIGYDAITRIVNLEDSDEDRKLCARARLHYDVWVRHVIMNAVPWTVDTPTSGRTMARL